MRGGAEPPLQSARRVRNERLPVTSSLFFGSYIVWKAAARCWLLHAELYSELTLSCSRRFRFTIPFSPSDVCRLISSSEKKRKMSASAAKVSKKELNSNHDGADETSGKGNGGLLFTAIFTFFSNNVLLCLKCFLFSLHLDKTTHCYCFTPPGCICCS